MGLQNLSWVACQRFQTVQKLSDLCLTHPGTCPSMWACIQAYRVHTPGLRDVVLNYPVSSLLLGCVDVPQDGELRLYDEPVVQVAWSLPGWHP